MQVAIEGGEDSRTLLSLLDNEWNVAYTGSFNKISSITDNAEPASKDLILKANVKFTKYWHDLVSAPDPAGICLNAAVSFLDKHPRHCELLALLPDKYGRTAVDMSSPRIQIALQSRLLFCRRYELDVIPVHVSRTCEVIFAKDHQPRFDHFEAIAMDTGLSNHQELLKEKENEEVEEGQEENDGKSKKEMTKNQKQSSDYNLPVALKFMRSREALQREIRCRRETENWGEAGGDQERRGKSYVIEVLGWHLPQGESLFPEDPRERKFATPKDGDRSEFPYILVMRRAKQSCHTAMQSRRFAGHDIMRCQQIARNLARCLRRLHRFGVIHGDVKPRNILFLDEEDTTDGTTDRRKSHRLGDLVLCDLDVSTSIGSARQLSHKMPSSAHSAPELQRWKIWAALPERQRHTSMQLKASEALDIWGFGTVLYELCAGQELFDRNFADDEIVDVSDEMRK